MTPVHQGFDIQNQIIDTLKGKIEELFNDHIDLVQVVKKQQKRIHQLERMMNMTTNSEDLTSSGGNFDINDKGTAEMSAITENSPRE